jgi:hypothetical protein
MSLTTKIKKLEILNPDQRWNRGLPKHRKLNKFDSNKSKSIVREAPEKKVGSKSKKFWNWKVYIA